MAMTAQIYVPRRSFAATLKALAHWPQRRRRNVIDIRELPDHILRDIGALDGVDRRR